MVPLIRVRMAAVWAAGLALWALNPTPAFASSHVSVSEKITTDAQKEATDLKYDFHVAESESEDYWFENYQWDVTPHWYQHGDTSTDDNSGGHPWRVHVHCYGNHAEPNTELTLTGEGDLNNDNQLYLDNVTVEYAASGASPLAGTKLLPDHGFFFANWKPAVGAALDTLIYAFVNTDATWSLTLDSLRVYQSPRWLPDSVQWDSLALVATLLAERLGPRPVAPGDSVYVLVVPVPPLARTSHIYVAGVMHTVSPGQVSKVRAQFRHGHQLDPVTRVVEAGTPAARGARLDCRLADARTVELRGPLYERGAAYLVDVTGRVRGTLWRGEFAGTTSLVLDRVAAWRAAPRGLYTIVLRGGAGEATVRVLR